MNGIDIMFADTKYMERRGSRLRKIISETEKLPGYKKEYKPEFSSTASDFMVTLKNVNYHLSQSVMDTTHDKILVFCVIPHTKSEIAEHCGYKNTKNFTKKYLRPLLNNGMLQMTLPDKPRSKNQKYITVHSK